MKKAIKTIFTVLLSVIVLFSVACTEECAYLNENLDKSNLTRIEFAEWMYNRTKTSIKLNRPDSEIVYNVKTLMEDFEVTEEYLDSVEATELKNRAKNEHLEYYSLLDDVLVEHAKRSSSGEIWVGKTWRDVGRALNMTSNGEVMALIAKQIMAKGKPVTEYAMYKEIKRADVASGEEVVEVVYEGKTDAQDTVRVKFYDAEKAYEIAVTFVQNALYFRPVSTIGSLYVQSVMYDFSNFIGYDEPYIAVEEYNPGNGESVDGEQMPDTEIVVTKVDLYEFYTEEYSTYIG